MNDVLLFYILPTLAMSVFFMRDTWRDWRKDLFNRDDAAVPYKPRLTVGEVASRLFMTLCPVINVFVLIIFLCAASDKLWKQPVVPPRRPR